MKFLFALTLVLLLVGICFADVDAVILQYDKDENGNIKVYTNYKIDGVEVKSAYPKLNDKYYYVTRYDAANFYGMDKAQIESRIQVDIKQFGERLVYRAFIQKENDRILTDDTLKDLVGKQVKITETTIQIDTNKDGTLDKELQVKTDGTKTVTDINITPDLQ